jgi:hypothetical protein
MSQNSDHHTSFPSYDDHRRHHYFLLMLLLMHLHQMRLLLLLPLELHRWLVLRLHCYLLSLGRHLLYLSHLENFLEL